MADRAKRDVGEMRPSLSEEEEMEEENKKHR